MVSECIADPSTTARWSAAKQSDKIIPQWNLRQKCLCTVKDSILGWSRGRSGLDPHSETENPFLEYPIQLRYDILHQLLRLKPTGRELLKAAELLVCSGVPAFDLGCLDDCKFNDVCSVLEKLTRTGSCLRELGLIGQWLYQPSSIELVKDILSASPNLFHLRLQHTTKEGRELEYACSNCPKLRHLEVMHPSTDDEDIQSLVDALSHEEFESTRQNLSEIKLPSSVNGRSVLHLMQALPNLRYISCTYLDQVLDELEEQEDQAYWRERTSKVLGIQATLPVSEDTVSILTEWFPNLEEVSLEVQEDMELGSLASLPKLRTLELKNSPTLPASYLEEVLPLLSACGKKLLSLSLERFDVVDLAKTAMFCPNLRSFSAQWFTMLGTTTGRRATMPFLNLRYLRLRPRVNRKVTPEACEILLTNSQTLRHLEFYCSYGLTDSLVSKIVKTNKFTNLRTLLLRHGHGLSSSGIRLLTRASSKLKSWDVGAVATKARA